MFKDYRASAQGFSDLLNYLFFIDEGILLQKDGSLCFGLYYRGPDFTSVTVETKADISAQLNSIFDQLGNGWMLHTDFIRQPSRDYITEAQCYFPDPTSLLVDRERRKHYMSDKKHFESVYAIVLTYRPPSEIAKRFKKFFVHEKKEEPGWEQVIDFFKSKCSRVLYSLRRFFLVETMRSQDLLNHLFFCIHGKNFFLKLPQHPINIDSFLGNAQLVAGYYPNIGATNLYTISVVGFPLESYPGVLQALEQLPVPFRWSNRFIFVEKAAAKKIMHDYRRYWLQSRYSLGALVQNALFPQQMPAVSNRDADVMADDVYEALAEAESDVVKYGFYTSVIVLHRTPGIESDQDVLLVLKTLEHCGFVGRIETGNALEAYVGSLPGHGYQNIRKPLIHTLNYADFLPLYSVWTGHATHPCRYYGADAPPLMYAETTGAIPFRFFLHQQDVGHSLIIGDTGSGKSTLVGLIALQHLRYKHAQVFIFDKGYSSYILCKAVGGTHYDLGGAEQELTFYPLNDIQDAEYFNLSLEWLEIIFECQGIILNAIQRRELHDALLRLATQEQRTLTNLQSTLQDELLKNALEYYTLSGAMGQILDGATDKFSQTNFQVFEMGHLLERNAAAILPTIFYLFLKIERQFNGQPTLLIIEEGHRFLSGKFGQKLEQWLRELRKKNVSVIFLTQHLSEIINSSVGSIVINSCKTKIFLPNPHAADGVNSKVFEEIGISIMQMEAIKYATPKKEYYYTSPSGSRLIALALDELALSFVGVDSECDRRRVDQLISMHNDQWPVYWLQERGLVAEAQAWRRAKENVVRGELCS